MRLLLNHTFAGSVSSSGRQPHVFLASILAGPGKITDCAANFNANMVQSIVADFSGRGHTISYVPAAESTGLCAVAGQPQASLCAVDNVHPNSAGYLKLASAFSFAILKDFKPCNK